MQAGPQIMIPKFSEHELNLECGSELASPILKSNESRLSTNESPVISPRKCEMGEGVFEEEE